MEKRVKLLLVLTRLSDSMGKVVRARRPMARVSVKDSVKIFRKIKNRPVTKVKTFLKNLINQKNSIEGKFFTKAATEILDLIEEAEKNAESEGLDEERLFIKEATVNKGLRFYLPKSRWRHRGRRAKICQLNITLEER